VMLQVPESRLSRTRDETMKVIEQIISHKHLLTPF
jgi:hypothetical protein